MLKVAQSDIRYHLIAAEDTGIAEKNIVNSERGIIAEWGLLATYYPNGKAEIRLPHIRFETTNGEKIIYIAGYGDASKWKKVLGSQMGCVYIDEVNVCAIEFLREISHRCKYMMTTNNPDAPNLPVYKEFINRSRPLDKYKKDYPQELLADLTEPNVKGWVHWYFTFYDNASMTEEEIQEKIEAVPVGTKMYKNKILGLRGRCTGLVFSNFERQRHVITAEQARAYIRRPHDKAQTEYFVKFVTGCDTAYSQKSPDTIAMLFCGLTNKGRWLVLDERVYNNANIGTPIAPSDTVQNLIAFADRNGEAWGVGRDIFVDSADTATLTECAKYKRQHGSVYNFVPAWKETKIIDRINLQLGWFAQDYFQIVDSCKTYIQELEIYSWLEDKDNTPEDGNDHCVNATQYAFLPYKGQIGTERGK